MKVGVGTTDSCLDFCLDFEILVEKIAHKNKQVDYHRTVTAIEALIRKKIRANKYDREATVLVIPHRAQPPFEERYRASTFIDYLRLSLYDEVSSLPIIVMHSEGTDGDVELELSLHLKTKSVLSVFKAGEWEMPRRLRDTDLRKLTETIASRPKLQGSHDLANIWGPYRLANSLYMALGLAEDELDGLRERLVSQWPPHYRALIALESRSPIAAEPEALESLKKAYQTLQEQLASLSNQNEKINILVIEDELEQGWKNVYKALFESANEHVYIEWIDSEEDAETLLKKDQKFDLVLLDLRLNREQDRELIYQRNIHELSGVKVLRKLKEKDFSLPVLVTTASNKFWSLEAVLDEGADGFWNKEGPVTGADINHALVNAEALVGRTAQLIEWSIKVRPVLSNFEKMLGLLNEHSFWKRAPQQKDAYCSMAEKKLNTVKAILRRPESAAIERLSGESQWESVALLAWNAILMKKQLDIAPPDGELQSLSANFELGAGLDTSYEFAAQMSRYMVEPPTLKIDAKHFAISLGDTRKHSRSSRLILFLYLYALKRQQSECYQTTCPGCEKCGLSDHDLSMEYSEKIKQWMTVAVSESGNDFDTLRKTLSGYKANTHGVDELDSELSSCNSEIKTKFKALFAKTPAFMCLNIPKGIVSRTTSKAFDKEMRPRALQFSGPIELVDPKE